MLNKSEYIVLSSQDLKKKLMEIKNFNNHGLDSLGIHWMQYISMTLISLLIFLIGLDKAVPSFHHFILSLLFKLQCSGFNCNGVKIIQSQLFSCNCSIKIHHEIYKVNLSLLLKKLINIDNLINTWFFTLLFLSGSWITRLKLV